MASEVAFSDPRRKRARWSFAVAIVLSGVFLVLAVRGVDWHEILAMAAHIRLAPFGVAVPLLASSYVFRGLRWAILLRREAPVERRVAVWASLIGYLANGYLPARAGEPIRAMMVSRHSAVSVSGALATALTERLVDAAILTTIAITAVANAPSLPDWLRGGAWTMAAFAGTGLVGLFVAPRFQPLADRLVRRLPLSPPWSEKISRWLHQFLDGLRALYSIETALPFLALTTLVWVIDANVALIVARTVDLHVSFFQTLALLSALGLATAAPSTPGYLGIYQFVAVSVLEPFGASRSQALVFIVAFQATVYAVVTVGGGLGLWTLSGKGRMDGA